MTVQYLIFHKRKIVAGHIAASQRMVMCVQAFYTITQTILITTKKVNK